MSLQARVRNGRLVLDEPTDLPEGQVVYLELAGEGEMDPEERAALDASIRESLEQMSRGELVDADKALAEIRAHR